MTDKTEQKILDAALKIFAEKGYAGATTRVIAQESGFSELTLFRKFETKENLFNRVITQNNEKMMKDFGSVFIDKEFENSREFLKTLIKNLAKLGEDNFEIIHLVNRESSKIHGNFIEEFVNDLSEYVEKNVCNDKINYKVFVFSIISFVYVLLLDQKHIFNREEAINEFINNSVLCVS